MSNEPSYRLADRRTGTMLFGLAPAQLVLVVVGVVAAVLVPAAHRSVLAVLAGLAVAAGCGVLAFMPVGGGPAWQALLVGGGFLGRRVTSGHRWVAPLPLLAATASTPADRVGRARPLLPGCLAGLGLLAVPRAQWAGAERTVAQVGLVLDRRSGSVTAVISAAGSGFSLLDPPEQHRRLAGWAQVLSQFAREASPVTRLGWSLWSAPGPLAEHLAWLDTQLDLDGADTSVAGDYRRLVAETTVTRHELRVWLSVDPRRVGGSADAAAQAAVGAARVLSDRCAAAGLVCGPPLSPVQIAEAIRVQADPSAAGQVQRLRRGLAQRTGLASALATTPDGRPVGLAHAAPLAMQVYWDAVRIDGAWHRVFWVSQWPGLDLTPGWWEPLLLGPVGVRALAVVMEPVGARASRRRINAEAVSLQGQLQLRERHTFRVPVGLRQAQAELEQREAELQAGFPEYGYLALACVTAATRAELEEASQALVDAAARCGIIELRPLHGRHDAAWACTLPIGRVPDRELLGRGAR